MQQWTASYSSVKNSVDEAVHALEKVTSNIDEGKRYSKWKDKVEECNAKGIQINATSKRTDRWIRKSIGSLSAGFVEGYKAMFPEDKVHTAMDGVFNANAVDYPSTDAGTAEFDAYFAPHFATLLDRFCSATAEQAALPTCGFPWTTQDAGQHLEAFARFYVTFASKAIATYTAKETGRLADVAIAANEKIRKYNARLKPAQKDKVKPAVAAATCTKMPMHLLIARTLLEIKDLEEGAVSKKWPAAVYLLHTHGTKSYSQAQVECGWSDLNDNVTDQRQGMTLAHVEQLM